MISNEAIVSYLRATMPDAEVSITDRTGTRDHFSIRVVSAAFKDKNLLDRNRLIYHALREPMADGRIHAMELKAHTPDEASVASN
jgi:stress-induced morphogen